MSNKPKNVRCPLCGKFMHLNAEILNHKNVIVRHYVHMCGPEQEHRLAQREFQSADNKHWYYVRGAGTYTDFQGRKHVWTESGDKLSEVQKIERWATGITRAHSLKTWITAQDDLDSIMLYDEDEQKQAVISYANLNTGVLFLKHKK